MMVNMAFIGWLIVITLFVELIAKVVKSDKGETFAEIIDVLATCVVIWWVITMMQKF